MAYKTIRIKKRSFTWKRAHMLALANSAADAIKVRSFTKGLGVDERPYSQTKPYNPAYKAHKLAKFGGLNWLSYTGRLRQSIRVVRHTRTAAVIKSVGVSYAAKVNKERPFMASSPIVRKVIKATFIALAKAANR